MAVVTLRFNARTIGLATQVRLILPTGVLSPDTDFEKHYAEKNRLPVLWLLHGGSDNYSDWHNCTEVQVLADKYGYAVVMPDAQMSSYTNMAYGPEWQDYFTDELPEYIYSRFPISRERKDNFISGMSMGGGGALKLSLLDPERYSVCVPIASAVEIIKKYTSGAEGGPAGKFFADIYGHEDDPRALLGSDDDCYWLLERNVREGKPMPKFEFCVGLDDFTRDGNVDFRKYAEDLGVHIDWYEEPGGHNWDSWNAYIPKVFEYISRCRREEGLE